ncbi:MAG TPA: SprT-like domain-containing protein [Gemmatimonadaceae bacterium]
MRAIRRSVRAAIAHRDARRRTSTSVAPSARPRRAARLLRTHPDDEPIAMQLLEWHRRLNAERFDGRLSTIAVRVSRRMRSRLGHYAPAQRGAPAEIAISRRHVRRHGFEQALQTLLHEMVHQWQDESGLPLSHGADFRRKAREVGITARATRAVD